MNILSLILGAIVGAIPSWYMSKYFASRSSKELESRLKKLTNELNSTATVQNFEKLLKSSRWVKEFVGQEEMWVCENNRTFQIHFNKSERMFKEKWTEIFPDQYTTMFQIYLKVQGVTITSLPFISADGGRYTMPLPKLVVVENTPHYYWNPNSIEYKVAEVIGNFYRYKTLKEVAAFVKIELNTANNYA